MGGVVATRLLLLFTGVELRFALSAGRAVVGVSTDTKSWSSSRLVILLLVAS
jgi:hypothetical protein